MYNKTMSRRWSPLKGSHPINSWNCERSLMMQGWVYLSTLSTATLLPVATYQEDKPCPCHLSWQYFLVMDDDCLWIKRFWRSPAWWFGSLIPTPERGRSWIWIYLRYRADPKPGTGEAEAGGSQGVWGPPGLQSKFRDSQSYTKKQQIRNYSPDSCPDFTGWWTSCRMK